MPKLTVKNSLVILLVCILVFVGSFASAIYLIHGDMEQACNEKAERDLDIVLGGFDLELSRAEQSLSTFVATVYENGERIPDKEEIYRQMELFLNNNPYLSGIVASFEDSVFPEYADKNGFSPLIRHQGDSLVRYQIGETRDVRVVNDWYMVPKEHDIRVWSRPFSSEEGDLISCFSIPLHQNGKVIGVAAVDLSLSRIKDLIGRIKPTPDATVTLMLTTDLTYMIHPNHAYEMNKTMAETFHELGIDVSHELLQNIMDRKRGRELLSWGSHSSYVYYGPVEKARCAAMIDVPRQTVMAPLTEIFINMLTCAGVGLLVLIIFLITRTRFSPSLK